MGACAQIAVFTYAVMRRTPRREIRLAAPFADNLMNSVAHCGELPINVERPLRHIYELGAWLETQDCRRPDKFRLYPFFCLSVGTGDRIKLVCTLLPPQCGHKRQDQASLCPSSASAWAQEIGASFSVPLNQGTGRYTQDLTITPRVMKATGA